MAAEPGPPPARVEPATLPHSGVGVDGPWLVIAPPGNPRIRLDARLLDDVRVVGRSPASAIAVGAGASVGAGLAAVDLLVGGAITAIGLGVVAVDRALEWRRRLRNRDLLLTLGKLDVALHIADGARATEDLAARLRPYTRRAPISSAEVYEDARRRLAAAVAVERAPAAAATGALTIGADDVAVHDGLLRVGETTFTVEQVRDLAMRGANLVLPGGRLLQAAVGLLVVAAAERARDGEDVVALSARVAAYEAWSGRAGGR
jgi:hypothetical protein